MIAGTRTRISKLFRKRYDFAAAGATDAISVDATPMLDDPMSFCIFAGNGFDLAAGKSSVGDLRHNFIHNLRLDEPGDPRAAQAAVQLDGRSFGSGRSFS